MSENVSQGTRWTEIYSLAALSASIAISWIAYHEYQPHLLESFQFGELSVFLVVAKALVLVIIPPLAGLLSDYMSRRNGKTFFVFSVGIGLTAMVFMVVASVVGAGPVSNIRFLLPYLIVIWLIAMNIFNSPALSMIDTFAPTKKLPLVVGFLFFITELIYALEPVIVELVRFLGETLTFITGGVLIGGTGFIFYKISSKQVLQHREYMDQTPTGSISRRDFAVIVILGLILGTGNAFLIEFVPEQSRLFEGTVESFGAYFSFGLLGFSAFLAFALSGYVSRIGFRKVIVPSSLVIILMVGLLLLTTNRTVFISGSVLLAIAFGMLNISALPFAISKLPTRILTLGIGIFLGATFLIEGLLEYIYI